MDLLVGGNLFIHFSCVDREVGRTRSFFSNLKSNPLLLHPPSAPSHHKPLLVHKRNYKVRTKGIGRTYLLVHSCDLANLFSLSSSRASAGPCRAPPFPRPASVRTTFAARRTPKRACVTRRAWPPAPSSTWAAGATRTSTSPSSPSARRSPTPPRATTTSTSSPPPWSPRSRPRGARRTSATRPSSPTAWQWAWRG